MIKLSYVNSGHFQYTEDLKGKRVALLQKQPSESVFRRRCLKICSKFTGEHPCQSAISIKLQSNFTEIALWHECSPVNLMHVFRTLFPKNTS